MTDVDESADRGADLTGTGQLFDWLAERLDARAADLRLQPMPGATSSRVSRVTGASATAVLRQFTKVDWLAREPDLAWHEAAALKAASATGLPVPRLLGLYDPDGPVPAVLMSDLPGHVWLPSAPNRDWIEHLASCLARVHAVVPAELDWRYGTWTREDQLTVPEWGHDPAAWACGIDRFRGEPPATDPVLVHRDYHPVNLLWNDGRPTGVVDWVNACLGPAGIDIAHCSLNLVSMYGLDTAVAFREAYEGCRPGYAHSGYWDIEVVLGALPSPSFYPPWADFGLQVIEVEQLRGRLESLLVDALGR